MAARRLAVATALGFMAGAVLGFMYSQRVKGGIGEAVSTDFSGGKLTVTVDTVKAAAAGLPAFLR